MRMDSETTSRGLILTPMEAQIEAGSSAKFKSAVAEWIEGGHRCIVLDLERVNFIDSSGLGAILSLLKGVGQEGEILLCRINPAVNQMFRLTRMDRVFHIFETRSEALAHLSAKS